MKHITRKYLLAGFLLGSLAVPAAWAGSGSAALAKALDGHAGSTVTLRLSSGQELSGKLKPLDEDTVKLEELTGREFFDAVIPVKKIEALIMRRPAN